MTFLAEALNQNLGSLDLAKLTAQANAEKAGLIRLVEMPKQPLLSDYATKDGLKRELWSVHFVNKTKDCFPALNPTFEPNRKLTPEQRDAVKSVLSTPDQCCGVSRAETKVSAPKAPLNYRLYPCSRLPAKMTYI